MSIQSLVWLGWATAGVLGHWSVPLRFRDWFLIAFTLTFLCLYAPLSAVILLSLTGCTFLLTRERPVSGIAVAVLAVIMVGLLAAYKLSYGQLHFENGASIVIPLGLSYYTLRCLHYAIESYKGTLKPHSLTDFISYQLFFPALIAGPIHRFPEFHRDQNRRRWDPAMFSGGLERILFGFTKIVVLGNYLISQVIASRISDHIAIEGGMIGSSSDAWLPLFVYFDILRHGINLYFQFSGYSDVAIGFGMLFGFRIMENFNWPFLKKNVSEFWQSWHISLTGWCREYIYMVVISNWRSPALAAIAAMLAIGFWHEMSVRYLLWGVYHGIGIAIWQLFQRVKPSLPKFDGLIASRVTHCLSVALTFHFIVLGFSIVQGPNLTIAMQRWNILFLSWWN